MTFEKLVKYWGATLGIGFAVVVVTSISQPQATIPAVRAAVNVKDSVPIYSAANGKGFAVDVKLGGAPLRMVADTGATISSIPENFATWLLNNGGAVAQGSITVRLADGSRTQEAMILIREFQIGNHLLHNVPAAVSTGMTLLAFPVIDGIAPFTVDTRAGELVWHK